VGASRSTGASASLTVIRRRCVEDIENEAHAVTFPSFGSADANYKNASGLLERCWLVTVDDSIRERALVDIALDQRLYEWAQARE
jgi:hypothetical protein